MNNTNTIVTKILELAQKSLTHNQLNAFAVFVEQFYSNDVINDFANRQPEELLNNILAHWQLMYQRASNQCKLQVLNPSLDNNSDFQYTIILLIQDDMPFLVDSLQIALNKLECNIQNLLHLGGLKVKRDDNGNVIDVFGIKQLQDSNVDNNIFSEAPIYIEIERQFDNKKLQQIEQELLSVLQDVHDAVNDWQPMQNAMLQSAIELENNFVNLNANDYDLKLWQEAKDFLNWLADGHFIFLGCRSYKFVHDANDNIIEFIDNSNLGFLKNKHVKKNSRYYKELPKEVVDVLHNNEPLILVKTNTLSSVHKPIYTDSVIVKKYDSNGNFIGIQRFIGIYARTLYHNSVSIVPYLRYKSEQILQQFGMPAKGYSAKSLRNIIETFPRDEFIQANIDELYNITTGIFQLHERRLVKLFVRHDIYRHYVSCLVYLPRDNFNTELRLRLQDTLIHTFNGLGCDFDIWFSASILARIHFIIRVDAKKDIDYDFNLLETEIINLASSWNDGLRNDLHKIYTHKQAENLAIKYSKSFPSSFCEKFSPTFAVQDIAKIETLLTNNSNITNENTKNIELSFYHLPNTANHLLNLKLFYLDNSLALSDTLPILENLGLRVINEQTYVVQPNGTATIYISDFNMLMRKNDVNCIAEDQFIDAFKAIWQEQAENDGFNKLVLFAGLSWNTITILRAYTKYLWQIRFPYTQQTIENAFVHYPQIANLCINYFVNKFDPQNYKSIDERQQEQTKIQHELKIQLEQVTSLDEETIINMFFAVIDATVRTNFYQNKDYISFKFHSASVPNLPLPQPLFEIFVYASYFEGVHLRMAKVARGGLRWSDRKDDFRTEVLGLVKAQNVKNVVIVPHGAKGGFVLKRNIENKDMLKQEGIACYKKFISGLLDITDNIIDNNVMQPNNVICYDEQDPYLVVAADKGTASFSDIANKISQEYNFWLKDAFASGGSAGYDHKKLGITARGAWESVVHHFYQLGINVAQDEFTVIGIGDMAGDVFGNGMLLSKHIKLVGAFNHQHIFIDPNPDVNHSFQERQRLFNLPNSTWDDYNRNIISAGGGIYLRSAKTIPLTQEAQKLLDLHQSSATPYQVIQALLKAQVDLLWNGGIGTYVKASTETHESVGDRSNDKLRINANELRCKVIGEGGNLGLTQLARIEYGLNNGICNTDFIDNSGGVDCSDHEVNIKILLNGIIDDKKLDLQNRNILLATMTEEVSNLVLQNNYRQTRAIGLFTANALENLDKYRQFIDHCEASGKLNRELEFLPNNKTLQERLANQQGLARAEIAVLLAYAKLIVKEQILASSIIDDEYFIKYIAKEFPRILVEKYPEQIYNHRLRREIITTHLSNDLITDLGIGFYENLHQENQFSDLLIDDLIFAYILAKEFITSDTINADIQQLDFIISAKSQMDLTQEYRANLKLLTIKFINYVKKFGKNQIAILQLVYRLLNAKQEILNKKDELFNIQNQEILNNKHNLLITQQIPQELVQHFVYFDMLPTILDVVAIADLTKMPVVQAWKIRELI